jgi:hypothetical protein
MNGQVITRVESRVIFVDIGGQYGTPTFLSSSTKEFVTYTIPSYNGSNNAIITLV